MEKLSFAIVSLCAAASVAPRALLAIDNPGAVCGEPAESRFTLVAGSRPVPAVYVAPGENSAVRIAADNLAADFGRVTGIDAVRAGSPSLARTLVVAGVVDGPTLKPLVDAGAIDPAPLAGKREVYRMSFVKRPWPGVDEALVIAGSDRRGAVYGIYELSEQIGVSPWYDWADAPVPRRRTLAIERGVYTNGEPAVRWRGIFLNDEAPCLTSWVKNTYGTGFGDHRFYARVGELILRLRGNFLWPAMWCWAFYADDSENSATMDAMGVAIGTSHHEPMARNHQEWARRRNKSGPWNYRTNQETLDAFFAEGVRRARGTEDLITIGMRGDGDVEMDGTGDIGLMDRIISNQRAIIEREQGRPAAEVPQVWALYKEVQDTYDKGFRPPDDVTILLCDDNWGDLRRLPGPEERRRSGGWGIYYHVDYVGAPRNSKFINVTSAASMWEQLSLAGEYGVDRLWVLNVGDLKPMEYPITLFMDMAWNPSRYTASSLPEFTLNFCERFFGRGEAAEAARILDATSRYACRITPEMLDAGTYDLESGEWAKVAGDYARLAADAEAQYSRLPEEAKAAYFEIVLFHVRAMSNLYEMYFAQALGDAERVAAAFARHGELCAEYNNSLAGGKWKGMMTQKVIGYTSWHDNFAGDTCPKVAAGDAAAEAAADAARAAELLAAKEPRIYSVQRSKSYDANMGENWWMRRHDAILERLKSEREFDLVLAGDSITHRWERHGREAYVQVTNELKVLNLGFGADNVRNLLWRFRSGELDGYRAKAIQLMIGTNNSVSESPETTAAEIRAALREIRARQPQAKILLSPILPRGKPDSVERGKNEAVNALLRPLADGKTIEWADWSGFFTLPDGRLKPDLQDDGLHPNAKGYAEWAKVALPVWKAAAGLAPAAGASAGSEVGAGRKDSAKDAPEGAGFVALQAHEFASAVAPGGFRWEFIAGLGRGDGAMEVFPRLEPPRGAKLVYKVAAPEGAKSATVVVSTRSTLAFARREGHRYTVAFAGGPAKEVNFNSRLDERPENIYSVFYPTVARRVASCRVRFDVLPGRDGDGLLTLELAPLDQGVAFESVVVDFGGAPRQYLLGTR